MESSINALIDPATIAALAALVVMEIVLGIDNLVFISILTNKLPEHQRRKARRLGIGLALVIRLGLLSMISWLVGLTKPLFDLGITGELDSRGRPTFETQFSWRDFILIAGGLFLLWKATKEIHHSVDPAPVDDIFEKRSVATLSLGAGLHSMRTVIRYSGGRQHGVRDRFSRLAAVSRHN